MRKLWKRIMCLFGDHEVAVIGRPNEFCAHSVCVHCGAQFATNHDAGLTVPWSITIAEHHRARDGYEPKPH